MNAGSVIGKVGKFKVCFRDEQLTSHAGVVLVHELATRLGVEQLVDEELQVKQRERGYTEGQAIGALVQNLLLGGESLRVRPRSLREITQFPHHQADRCQVHERQRIAEAIFKVLGQPTTPLEPRHRALDNPAFR